MDQSSFDRIARLLGGATTRRRGLAAALGTALGLPLLADAEARDGKDAAKGKGRDRDRNGNRGKGKGKGKDKPAIEGPCGDGSRKDNLCTKDTQCCTGICKKGLKNKDGKGRCRCMKKGKSCTADKNCCGGRTCTDGVCGGGATPTIPTSDPCVEGVDTCADPNATCTTYDAGSSGPAGTYCLLPFQNTDCTKAADCACNNCYDGTCVTASCNVLPDNACSTINVCATCTYQTVQAAMDAAPDNTVVTIGPGAYSEDLTLSGKNLVLLGCPSGSDEIVITNATYGVRTITVSDVSDLAIYDIVINGYNDTANSQDGGGIETAGGDLCIGLRSRIENCVKNGDNGGGLAFGYVSSSDRAQLIIGDATIIQDNHADSYGGGFFADSYTDTFISGGAAIKNNDSSSSGGGIAFHYGSTITISGAVTITGNTSGGVGGGIYKYGGGDPPNGVVGTIGGKATISGNTAAGSGGGIGFEFCDDTETFSVTGDVVISGNTGTKGGGFYIERASVLFQDNVKIITNTASDSASGDGGGIYFFNNSGSAVLPLHLKDNVEASGNTCDDEGGGVHMDGGAAIKLSGNATIKNNNAAYAGGGLFLYQNTTVVTIEGTASITGNTTIAGQYNGGGGIKGAGTNTVTGCAAVTGNTPDETKDVSCT